MASGTRRARLTLVAVAIAVATVAVVSAGPIWKWATTERVPWVLDDDHLRRGYALRGYATFRRGTSPPVPVDKSVAWYLVSGTTGIEIWHDEDGSIRETCWSPGGEVYRQCLYQSGQVESLRYEPPWWWGVTDQNEPTAPWWTER